ncbi:ferritin [Chitinophaga dinghuensis]|uniref:Ferritin n=2 Tax=Chitinophaga dinghuensis TaxID=1539050 RepID=A0A327VQR1_9BACT|nr:ferritin [Chitinophaga dinghuensis]
MVVIPQKAIMNRNRLSQTLLTGLNKQMTQEALAAQTYLSFAVWAADEGYNGIANFLFRHAGEERTHMMKFLQYIIERGAKPVIEAVPKPQSDPENVQDCFERIFQQEVGNTKGVYKLVKMSFEEEDWATWHFMQWFVQEQTEEEALALHLLDKIKVAGGKDAAAEALYTLDRDLAQLPDEVMLAQSKTTRNT